MAERLFIFRGSGELVLPVTPDSYKVDTGVNIEVVNIHTLGDVIMTGYGTLSNIKISCLLPAKNYYFASDDEPDYYIKQFQAWVQEKARLRFIVGDTGVNIPVVIENFSYGEKDGTNDIYADITLREYRALAVQQFTTQAGASRGRDTLKKASGTKTYVTQYNDSLEGICRAEYGDGSREMCNKLARYNGMIHTGLLSVGKTLKIPQPMP